jgi:hypothetical protein
VDLPFTWNFVALCVVQGLAVTAPRPSPALARVRARPLLGVVPLVGIGGAVAFYGAVGGAAERVADVAAIATPILAVAGLLALRLRAVALAVPMLYWIAWQHAGTRVADVAVDGLIVAACATLAWMTGILAPRWALAIAILVTTAVDVVQILSHDLQPVADAIARSQPSAGLPRLQEARWAGASMGWGDVYLAALLGTLTADRLRRNLLAASLVAVAAVAHGFLFLVLDTIPATIPVAAGLLLTALVDRSWAARDLLPPGVRTPRIRDTLTAPAKE